MNIDSLRPGVRIVSPQQVTYVVQIKLGNGAFGYVYQVVNENTGACFAMKIGLHHNNFRADQLVGEVTMYNHLDHFIPEDEKQYFGKLIESFIGQHYVVLILEMYRISLYDLLEHRDFQGFSLLQIQKNLRDVASGMKSLHDIRIIHCDLKPENIMITDDGHSKIIDFGSSTSIVANVSGYCQSRYYRAPETILRYTMGLPVDVWSFGCIVAELFLGYPIFAGKIEQNMLQLMELRLGKFPPQMIANSPVSSSFFAGDAVINEENYVHDECHFEPTTLHNLLMMNAEEEPVELAELFCDLVESCLVLDPQKRITFAEIVDHKFFFYQPP